MKKTLIDETETFDDIPIVSDIVPLDPDRITKLSLQGAWGVTTGMWTFEISNDPRVWPGNSVYDATNGKWTNITGLVGLANALGAADDDWATRDDIMAGWFRATFTPSAPGAAVQLWAVIT